jgi:hypothetical protein
MLMLIIFPIAFILAFIGSIVALVRDRKNAVFIFIIFALPIYSTALSVSFDLGLKWLVTVLQFSKELFVLAFFVNTILTLHQKPKLYLIDKFLLAYLGLNLLYLILPIGSFGWYEKLLAFKSISLLVFIYFIGRFMDTRKIYLNEVFSLVGLVGIAAAVVVIGEFFFDTHFQTITGYAQYNSYYFGQEPTGHYGLSWTFENESGYKRFASFFANPLDHAAATVITISMLLALTVSSKNQVRFNKFTLLILLATIASITFAFSRASFASYCMVFYVYSLVTKNRLVLKWANYAIFAGLMVIVFFGKDIYEHLVETVLLQDSSSLAHVTDWLNGIESIISHPFGIGLGASGRASVYDDLQIGGENALIIIGVQIGVIGMLFYILIYAQMIKKSYQMAMHSNGKYRKLALALLLIKIGSILPILSSDLESYIYISYMQWLLCGLMINYYYEEKSNSVQLS